MKEACEAPGPGGYLCSLEKGHTGLHCGSITWPIEPEDTYEGGYESGLNDAAIICTKYAHSGESTLRRNVCYAIERRIREALDDFLKNRR